MSPSTAPPFCSLTRTARMVPLTRPQTVTFCAVTLPSTCAPSLIRRSEARNSPSIQPKICAGPLHSMLPAVEDEGGGFDPLALISSLLGSLQLVHATGQISYHFHPSTRTDAFQRHQERAEPTHDSETADCRSRSNKKHQRGKGKQAGGQCQSSVARQCCDQNWKKEKGERGNTEILQKLTQVFDMLIHHSIPDAPFWAGGRAGQPREG